MCTHMRRLLILALFSMPLSSAEEGFDWFSSNWISDAESTIALNRAHGVSDEVLELFGPLFGKIRWNIAGNTLTFIDIDGTEYPDEFVIEPLSDGRFFLRFDDGASLIERTTRGFCLLRTVEVPPYEDGSPQMIGECFKNAGT